MKTSSCRPAEVWSLNTTAIPFIPDSSGKIAPTSDGGTGSPWANYE